MTCRLTPVLGPFFLGVLRHRLRYPVVGSSISTRRVLLNRSLTHNFVPMGKAGLSTRSGREGKGSGFRTDTRSLIDDEAELSDWVSGLSSSSKNKTRLYSDSGNDEGGNGGFKGREGAGKRRRDSAVDGDFDSRSKRRDASQDFFSGSRKNVGDSRTGMLRRKSNDREMGNFERGGGFERQFADNRGKRNGFMSGGNRGRGDGRQTDRRFESINERGGSVGRGGSKFRTFEKNPPKRQLFDDGTEEEERGDLYKNFKKLIESEEEEEDDDDENDVDDEEEVSNGGVQEAAFPVKSSGSSIGSDSYLSESRFDDCPVSPFSLKAVKDAGYEKMTLVQEATLPVILKGKDVLAKAKTGTGKTVAFLLPAIEVVAKLPQAAQSEKRPPILVLIICPTRELACQAAAEANKLLKYHRSIGTQVVIGGTRLALEQKRMQANPCQILVATPGRLRDHIENTAGFATRLMGVKVLVLDEADHLLGLGFRKEIERIVDAVPKQRQTLLFSATIPPEVRQICHIALKRDHEYINAVKEGSEDTHSQVRQTHLVADSDHHFSLLYTLLKDHIADDVHYKVLVFCTTAMVTKLVAELLSELKLNVREIHSRKSQSYRTKVSDEFRKSTGLILVTSDVSARGVDYPDVTLVVQMGLPADKQQYIHRLGRTGRKGKEGQGILLLAPWEEFFLSSIKDLPVSKASPPIVDPETRKKVDRALSYVEMKTKEAAYQAWLGYYNSNSNVGRDKFRLVELANEFSRCMGLDNPPAIPKLVLGKMGLKNVPGLRSK